MFQLDGQDPALLALTKGVSLLLPSGTQSRPDSESNKTFEKVWLEYDQVDRILVPDEPTLDIAESQIEGRQSEVAKPTIAVEPEQNSFEITEQFGPNHPPHLPAEPEVPHDDDEVSTQDVQPLDDDEAKTQDVKPHDELPLPEGLTEPRDEVVGVFAIPSKTAKVPPAPTDRPRDQVVKASQVAPAPLVNQFGDVPQRAQYVGPEDVGSDEKRLTIPVEGGGVVSKPVDKTAQESRPASPVLSALPQRPTVDAPLPTLKPHTLISLSAAPTVPPAHVGLPSFHEALTNVVSAPVETEARFAPPTAAPASNITPVTTPSVAHPAQAPHIAAQIATAVTQSGTTTTEIALNPQELGRVRLTLTTTEAGITVAIIAERPETTDLMRRNLEHLAREFYDLGHENLTFSFGEQTENQDQTNKDSDASMMSGDATPDVETHTFIQVRIAASGSLDLKL